MRIVNLLLCLYPIVLCRSKDGEISRRQHGERPHNTSDLAQSVEPPHNYIEIRYTSSLPPSVKPLNSIKMRHSFSTVSMNVITGAQSPWFLNVTNAIEPWLSNLFDGERTACQVRIYGVLDSDGESKIHSFPQSGLARLDISSVDPDERILRCVYLTDYHFAERQFDFKFSPSGGVAFYCPVLIRRDDEIQKSHMCESLQSKSSNLTLSFPFTSDTIFDLPQKSSKNVVTSSFEINPRIYRVVSSSGVSFLPLTFGKQNSTATVPSAAHVLRLRKRVVEKQAQRHAVATAQVFMNDFSGPQLYLFASYYLKMGYLVIIYDRFGNHKSHLDSFMDNEWFEYHPFTIMQVAYPEKFTRTMARKQDTEFKRYFSRETVGDHVSVVNSVADTNEQDGDKRKTYNIARIEYTHVKSLLLVDADELLWCPESPNQQDELNKVMDSPEVHFSRNFVFARLNSSTGSSNMSIDKTRILSSLNIASGLCMLAGYENKNYKYMLECWGGLELENSKIWPKAADVEALCPFHFNHYACSPKSDHSPNK
jgi:hypothetical protein